MSAARTWLGALALALLVGCDLPSNMSDQPRYEPLEASDAFDDGMSSRRLVEGTVPRTPDPGAPLGAAALAGDPLTRVRAGRELFGIYCTPCHGATGDGRGMIVQRGYPQPPSLHSERVLGLSDAALARVIAQGRGKMPPYGAHLPTEAARGAVVLFVRALQRSQRATLADVPPPERARLERARAQGDRP